MKKSLVLHVGMPKSGTTTIQKTLKGESKALAELGILYPEFGLRYGAHHLLVDPLVFHDNKLVPPPIFDQKVAMEIMLSWAEDKSLDKIVISSEALVSATGLRPSVAVLAQVFDLHIVVFFREQAAFVNSLLNQYRKMNLFRAHCGEGRLGQEAPAVASYLEIARLWRRGAPAAKLSVVPVEEGEDVWPKFVDLVDPGLAGLSPDRSGRNASLRPEAIAFIDWFTGGSRLKKPMERSRLMHILEVYSAMKRKSDPGLITLISPEREASIRAKAEPLNAELSRQFCDGRPILRSRTRARYVDLASLGPEVVLEVIDFVLDHYDRRLSSLKARVDSFESKL